MTRSHSSDTSLGQDSESAQRQRDPQSPGELEARALDRIGDFCDYLSAECGLADNTLAAYRNDLELLCDYLDQQRVPFPQEVTREILKEFLEQQRQQGKAATSLRRMISSLRACFRFLVVEGIVPQNPAADLILPKTWLRLPKTLSQRDAARLVMAPQLAPGSPTPLRDRAILELLYGTGLRVSELCDLQLESLRRREGFLRCIGKGRKERLVPIAGEALDALDRYLEQERPALLGKLDGPHVFLSIRGKRLGRETIGRLIKLYAQRAGISDATSPHTLRHSFASHMLAGGAGLREVQELLGHADIRTTQIYTHVDRARLRQVHQRYHPRS